MVRAIPTKLETENGTYYYASDGTTNPVVTGKLINNTHDTLKFPLQFFSHREEANMGENCENLHILNL